MKRISYLIALFALLFYAMPSIDNASAGCTLGASGCAQYDNKKVQMTVSQSKEYGASATEAKENAKKVCAEKKDKAMKSCEDSVKSWKEACESDPAGCKAGDAKCKSSPKTLCKKATSTTKANKDGLYPATAMGGYVWAYVSCDEIPEPKEID